MNTTSPGRAVWLPRLLIALACLLPLAATAQIAVTTQAVNVRAGPDRGFPLVTWLRPGTHVNVLGCVHGWRWCDVAVGRDRGWVYARYLSVRHRNQSSLVLHNGARLGIPLISFTLGPYWDSHYRNRPWWDDRNQWANRPPTWHPPPQHRPPSWQPPPQQRPRQPIAQPPRHPRAEPPPFGPPPAGRPPGRAG